MANYTARQQNDIICLQFHLLYTVFYRYEWRVIRRSRLLYYSTVNGSRASLGPSIYCMHDFSEIKNKIRGQRVKKSKKRERLGEGNETTQNTRTHSYKAKRIKNEKQQQQNFSRHLCCSEIFQDIFEAFCCNFPPSLHRCFPSLGYRYCISAYNRVVQTFCS